MRREDLYYVLFDQQKEFRKKIKLVDRELAKDILKLIPLKMPIIITGVRRCGKSTLLRIVKDKLDLKENEYIYINFNDERLIDFSIDDFQKILDYLNENEYKKECAFFIDEIQEADRWEKWINRIKDKHSILITGSNSKLLSKEISSVLTGRSISESLFPFRFKEYLASQNIAINKWRINRDLQVKIRKAFDKFLASGGFPQRVLTGEEIIISELYENILYRDIIGRFNKNLTKQIKEVSLYLLSNIASDISLRNISKIVQIKNISTVKEIIDSFESAFLFFQINKFDFSVKKQTINPKKIYCIDNGFGVSLGFRFSEDKGKLLENAVAIELKRRKYEFFYFKEKNECDFITRKGTKITQAIQVCYSLHENNKDREIKGIIDALKKFSLQNGLILTHDLEDEIVIENKKIIIKPVWRWLLEKL